MARSSGGGSRSGGSRSSSSSSSRSRSGSGSSMRPIRRMSNVYRSGYSKYLYYSKNQAHTAYFNYDPSSKPQSKLKFVVLIFYIPFMIAIISMLTQAVHVPYKTNIPDNINSEIVIQDNLHAIYDKTELVRSLERFRDETGVIPAVLTVKNDDWMNYYDNIGIYALEQYYDMFDDEQHWLIVYSLGVYYDADKQEYIDDWHWEGIIGDNTERTITESQMKYLTETMQKHFYDKDMNIDMAIKTTFDSLLDKWSKSEIQFEMLGMGIFMGVFVGFHMFAMMGGFDKTQYFKNARKIADNAYVINCLMCNGSYVTTDMTCPHCGAANEKYNAASNIADRNTEIVLNTGFDNNSYDNNNNNYNTTPTTGFDYSSYKPTATFKLNGKDYDPRK